MKRLLFVLLGTFVLVTGGMVTPARAGGEGCEVGGTLSCTTTGGECTTSYCEDWCEDYGGVRRANCSGGNCWCTCNSCIDG